MPGRPEHREKKVAAACSVSRGPVFSGQGIEGCLRTSLPTYRRGDTLRITRYDPGPKEETPMSQNRFPEGWDEGRVQRVLAHYQEQTEDEALAEDEADIESSETVMNVPRALVPKVRELIAKSQG